MLRHITTLILLSLFLQACSNEKLENTKPTPPKHEQNFQQLFDEAIHCAALIAIAEQIEHGELSTTGESFKWIGFTLGQANNYKVDGNLTADTEKQYSNKTLELFLQHKQKKADFDQQNHNDCIEQAKIYDPETQMQALLNKAKKMSQQNQQ